MAELVIKLIAAGKTQKKNVLNFKEEKKWKLKKKLPDQLMVLKLVGKEMNLPSVIVLDLQENQPMVQEEIHSDF